MMGQTNPPLEWTTLPLEQLKRHWNRQCSSAGTSNYSVGTDQRSTGTDCVALKRTAWRWNRLRGASCREANKRGANFWGSSQTMPTMASRRWQTGALVRERLVLPAGL